MKDDLFEELAESVRQRGAILKPPASRAFEVEAPDVRRIREAYNLSQAEFAALLGISVDTIQNWEQEHRTPAGPARVLLQVVAKHPKAVWDGAKPRRSA
jgi:putative transcriptional regulator